MKRRIFIDRYRFLLRREKLIKNPLCGRVCSLFTSVWISNNNAVAESWDLSGKCEWHKQKKNNRNWKPLRKSSMITSNFQLFNNSWAVDSQKQAQFTTFPFDFAQANELVKVENTHSIDKDSKWTMRFYLFQSISPFIYFFAK